MLRRTTLVRLTPCGSFVTGLILLAACSSDETEPPAPATGGQSVMTASGGTKAQGGTPASGGSQNTPTGGAANPAGAGGTTPASGQGGSQAGQSAVTGGSSGTAGGSPGGGMATGGGSGGTVPAGGAGQGGGGQGGEGPPAVRFVGRVDHSDGKGPKFAWSGSGIIARFEGTSVGVMLTGGQEYTAVLDGMVQPKLVPTNGTTPIATGLSAGIHTIELYRRTEANLGESQFLGFDFGGGALRSPPAPPARRLEVIGDSITCGYGNEGANMDCGFTPQTENHYLSYAAIAARNLGAELSTVAWSGKGVVCNYGDAADSCTNPLPTYYDRVLPDQANSQFDPSTYQPHAVVINLGTNDFSTDSDPSQAEFETAYKAFLEHIRLRYPSAYLLCTNGSMLSGTDLRTVRDYIANVVKARNDAGDTKVGSFLIEPQNASDGYGCDWHPSVKTHEKMAVVLETALKQALGW